MSGDNDLTKGWVESVKAIDDMADKVRIAGRQYGMSRIRQHLTKNAMEIKVGDTLSSRNSTVEVISIVSPEEIHVRDVYDGDVFEVELNLIQSVTLKVNGVSIPRGTGFTTSIQPKIEIGQVWQDKNIREIKYEVLEVKYDTVRVKSYHGEFWMKIEDLVSQAYLLTEEEDNTVEYEEPKKKEPQPDLPPEVHNDNELDPDKVWQEIRRSSRGY